MKTSVQRVLHGRAKGTAQLCQGRLHTCATALLTCAKASGTIHRRKRFK
ncbi:MAG: hypothetical protein Q4D33_10270 [Prevotellaceae bacterium]|nr:hypothetical protein [Prevotellaceae bacterium]